MFLQNTQTKFSLTPLMSLQQWFFLLIIFCILFSRHGSYAYQTSDKEAQGEGVIAKDLKTIYNYT